MKNLKLYFVATCLLIGGTQLSFGQEHPTEDATAPQKVHKVRKHKEMVKSLDLTSEQEAKMKEIKEAYSSEIEKVKINETLSDENRNQEIKTLRKKQHQEMNNVLTDEQKQKMKENRANSKGFEGQTHSKMTHEERTDSYIDRLDSIVSLTDDQRAKVQSTLEGFDKKRSGLRANTTLSKEVKETQIKQLRKDQKIAIGEILTKEQNKLLKEKKAERKQELKDHSEFRKSQKSTRINK